MRYVLVLVILLVLTVYPGIILAEECGEYSSSVNATVTIIDPPVFIGGGGTGSWPGLPPKCGFDPPIVFSLGVNGTNHHEAFISWTTDVETIGRAKFWASPVTYSVWTKVYQTTGHTVRLNSLKPSTVYTLRIVAKGRCGNIGISDRYTFTTKCLPGDIEIVPNTEPTKSSAQEFSPTLEDTLGEGPNWWISGLMVGVCILVLIVVFVLVRKYAK